MAYGSSPGGGFEMEWKVLLDEAMAYLTKEEPLT